MRVLFLYNNHTQDIIDFQANFRENCRIEHSNLRKTEYNQAALYDEVHVFGPYESFPVDHPNITYHAFIAKRCSTSTVKKVKPERQRLEITAEDLFQPEKELTELTDFQRDTASAILEEPDFYKKRTMLKQVFPDANVNSKKAINEFCKSIVKP